MKIRERKEQNEGCALKEWFIKLLEKDKLENGPCRSAKRFAGKLFLNAQSIMFLNIHYVSYSVNCEKFYLLHYYCTAIIIIKTFDSLN